jgi:tetratricopeptide (TPR) repeat protein
LTASLAQVGPLKVIATSSAARYQRSGKSPTEIARELRVDALVEGAVERSGDRVRITTQLIDGMSAHVMWAKTYDRDVRDALALQTEVTRTIADEISVQLTPEERERLASTRQPNSEAQDAYLRGLYWSQKSDYPRQLEQFKLATERDGSFGAAWAALSASYSLMMVSGRLSQKEGYPLVRAAVTRALTLDPGSAEAHGSLATLLQYHDWNWEESRREFQTALRLNPNSGYRRWYADGLAIVGRLDDAVTEAKRAQALDPFFRSSHVVLSHTLLFARRYDEVIDHARSLVGIDPALSHLGDWLTARALRQQGESARAVALLEPLVPHGEAGRLQGEPEILADLGASYAAVGRRADARRVLDALETMQKQGSARRPQSWHFAVIYTALGEKDHAFRYLDEGYAERPSEMMFLKVDPRIDPLRSDPRHTELLHRMGLRE